MPIIDTHAHIYGAQFTDLAEVAERAKEAGVTQILLSNVNADTLPDLHKAKERYPELFSLMIGLHPTDVKEEFEKELVLLYNELASNPQNYIAVGEIGLDYYWTTEFAQEMNVALRTQLHWALAFHKPVSLHAREAILDTIKAIKEVGADKLSGVFHSFTGNEAELEAILSLPHFMVGINGVFTFKNSHLPHFLPRLLPLERIVVETDAPYLAPHPKRGQRNESSFLPFTIAKLADAYGINYDEMEQQLYHNSLKIFPDLKYSSAP